MNYLFYRAAIAFIFLALAASSARADDKPFAIQVVDDATGRAVPLVELRTMTWQRFYTDSNGLVAFDEPGLMDQKIFFFVTSHGYEFPEDKNGFRGIKLNVTRGGSATIRIKRKNIAERLYRTTGYGIYKDSKLLGRPFPIKEPLLQARIVGTDSVINTIYRGRIFWAWGDTNQPEYRLGNFDVTCAISRLPKDGGLDPEKGIELEFYTNEKTGFVKPMARMPGKGPTWFTSLSTLTEGGRERLYATYVKSQGGSVYRHGLCVFDDEKDAFDLVNEYDEKAAIQPAGHSFKHSVGGEEFLYFANPLPTIRVRANAAALAESEEFESFSSLVPGTKASQPQLDKDSSGVTQFGWKKGTAALSKNEEYKLMLQLKLRREEGWHKLQDRDTGKEIITQTTSVYWNAHRQRWVAIILQSFGSPSYLGEVWYSEADAPHGPWIYCTRIMSHDDYSFYNPKRHPMFDKGSTIYFEGTYTRAFSKNNNVTPYYDYNQLMYKLDLDDPRLGAPVPVYEIAGEQGGFAFASAVKGRAVARIPFFALDRPAENAIGVHFDSRNGNGLLVAAKDFAVRGKPAFFALPADMKDPPPTTALLNEFLNSSGEKAYAVEGSSPGAGYILSRKGVCRVWRNPLSILWSPESGDASAREASKTAR